jgi:hypothetical protein
MASLQVIFANLRMGLHAALYCHLADLLLFSGIR